MIIKITALFKTELFLFFFALTGRNSFCYRLKRTKKRDVIHFLL